MADFQLDYIKHWSYKNNMLVHTFIFLNNVSSKFVLLKLNLLLSLCFGIYLVRFNSIWNRTMAHSNPNFWHSCAEFVMRYANQISGNI